MRFFTIIATMSVMLFTACQTLENDREKTNDSSSLKNDERVIVAKVNDYEISIDDFYDVLKKIPRHMRPEFQTPEGKRKLLDKMIARILFYDAGIKSGIMKEEEIVRSLKEHEIDFISETVKSRYLDEKKNEKALKDYYSKHTDKYLRDGKPLSFQSVKARVIGDFKREMLKEYITKLKKKSTLEVDEKIFEK